MEELNDILNDPVPYQRIKDIPELINVLDEQIKEVLQVKRTEATEKIQLDFEEASLHANQYGVSEKTKQRITSQFENFLANIEEFTDLIKLDATNQQSQTNKMRVIQKVRREIEESQSKKQLEAQAEKDSQVSEPTVAIKPEPVVQTEAVKLSDLTTIKTLSTEEDVDKYVNTLANKLKQIIRSNKEIELDRKSTRLNSSHVAISYAVFCLKKK